MGFVRVQKSKAYYSRFQVKYRRRREAKTDYQQRKALITQDKNKYSTPKYRLVVRFTNRDIICQIFSALVNHDKCIASAYSHELRRYGITVGLTNYAAAYATGLLLARRVNESLLLGYQGNLRIDGKEFHVKDDGQGMKPFKALLDVGLARTTTGARLFGALKGAADGGLDVPHNVRRFPGSYRDEDTKKWIYEPEEHRRYIFGQHVADYMRYLQENRPDFYNAQFSQYVKAGINADKIAALYARAHHLIRTKPQLARDAKELGFFGTRAAPKDAEHQPAKKHWGTIKMDKTQKVNRIHQILGARGQAPKARVELLKKKIA